MSKYCYACEEDHDKLTWHSLGMICARCHRHTGNNNQGHYWGLCKRLVESGLTFEEAVIELHFCCPGDCELK